MTDTEKSIKVIPFSGKTVDWQVWSEKFLARARRKGYKDILQGTRTVPGDSVSLTKKADGSDRTSAEMKRMTELREANEIAYEDLILSIDGTTDTGRVVFQFVRGAKTTEFANGDAREAWDRLIKKFEARTAPTRLMLKEKITNFKHKNRQDPEVYISKLEDLILQYNQAGGSWTEDEILEHICVHMPPVYEVVLTPLEKRIGAATNKLTLKELREELNLKFMKLNKGKAGDSEGSGDGEVGLFAGGFRGKCHKCGKIGHKSAECRSKNSGNDNKSQTGKDECRYCHEKGHWIKDCPKLKLKNERANAAVEEGEVSLVSATVADLKNEVGLLRLTKKDVSEFYIADSGASAHMTGSLQGMENIRDHVEDVTIGNGEKMKTSKIGDKVLTWKNNTTGEEVCVRLHNVRYVPEMGPFNLFSITYALSKGFTLGNEGQIIWLKKDGRKLMFDSILTTKFGYVCGAELFYCEDKAEIAKPSLNEGSTININEFHELLGHCGEEKTRAVAKYYGVKLTGPFKPCTACATAKARQANIPKSVSEEKRADKPGERLMFDVSSIKARSFGGAKYWLLVVDDKTRMSFSNFVKKKSEIAEKMVSMIKHIKKAYGYEVKYLRCDNAGENLKTKELCEKKGLGITFEFTAPNTPQQNGVVERRFATLYGRVRAMLNGAHLPKAFRGGLWAECARYATHLDNLEIDPETGKPRYETFFKKQYTAFRHSHKFGHVGIVANRAKIKSKIENKGFPALFLGHTDDSSDEVARLLKISSKRVIRSRDVRWLNKTISEFLKTEGMSDEFSDFDYADDNDDEMSVSTTDSNAEDDDSVESIDEESDNDER